MEREGESLCGGDETWNASTVTAQSPSLEACASSGDTHHRGKISSMPSRFGYGERRSGRAAFRWCSSPS